jgi:atypical dual specificity phosphatase
MGQYWSSNDESTTSSPDADRNWPWVWAILDTKQLDWKNSLSPEEVTALAKQQPQLPVQITETVFLSDARRAHDIERLKELKIAHVLNVAGKGSRGPVEESTKHGVEMLEIEGQDEEGYQMLANHTKEAQEWIEKARSSGGRCVVHCAAGANRSGVIVAAEKMLSERMSVLDVVAHCRRVRGNMFLFNEKFVLELVSLARSVDLLGAEPGEPGCRVTSHAPPMNDTTTRTLAGNQPAWRTDTRNFRSKDIRGLF